jgi:hypothetical protein
LFAALAAALDVAIVGADAQETSRIDGRIVIGDDRTAQRNFDDVPTLVLPDESLSRGNASAAIEIASREAVHALWRGRTLTEEWFDGFRPIVVQHGDEVLATVAGTPIWLRRHNSATTVAAAVPSELAQNESLRDRFRPGRFIELLPLLLLLRAAAARSAWSPPSLRATFLFDDPNLHRASYGYLRFDELSRAAAKHGYHAAFAMVPLDGWYASPTALGFFRGEHARLSLVMHGNDHVHAELGRSMSRDDRSALLAQALRRVASFESRYGVSVSRVMVPPHGRCSREMAGDMPAFGFEGLCISNPRPWQEADAPYEPLLGWKMVDVADKGLPIIPRVHVSRSLEELVFRAFLGQPIILYGHHADVAEGIDVLAEVADAVNGLGDVQWSSLTRIARSNFLTRRRGRQFHVRLYSRRVDVEVPTDIDELVIDWEAVHHAVGVITIQSSDESLALPVADGVSNAVRIRAPGRVRIALPHPRPLDPRAFRNPMWSPWPLTRRLLSETRDRLLPILE